MPSLTLFLVSLLLSASALSCREKPSPSTVTDPVHELAGHRSIPSLRDRIGIKNALVLSYLNGIDGKDYKFYTPDPEQINSLLSAIALFPPFLKKNLDENVTGIYFVHDFSSSGFTEWVRGPDGRIMSFIVLNSNVFEKNVSELVTIRENTCFKRDAIRTISVDLGKDPALEYILLHESVHAADYSHRINDYVDDGSRSVQAERRRFAKFMDAYWSGTDEVLPGYDLALRKRITFYGFGGGPLLEMREADLLYEGLVHSPFPSLYGSRLRAEDLAELVSIYHIAIQRKRGYRIHLKENGNVRKTYEPLRSKLLQKRFEDLKLFY